MGVYSGAATLAVSEATSGRVAAGNPERPALVSLKARRGHSSR